MRKKDNNAITEDENNIYVSITYGDKPLVDCMKNVIIRRISQKNK